MCARSEGVALAIPESVLPGQVSEIDVTARQDDANAVEAVGDAVFYERPQWYCTGGFHDDIHAFPDEPHRAHDGILWHRQYLLNLCPDDRKCKVTQ